MSKLEYRMYGLVPYNLSPIQQGIQFGHAVVEYGLKEFEREPYQDWAVRDKTFIILNGGTTNNNPKRFKKGTLNTYLDTLKEMGVQVATFHEPDLGDQLTAVVFLLDERIWDEEKYPYPYSLNGLNPTGYPYKKMVEAMGGVEVLQLRQFIKQFKLA